MKTIYIKTICLISVFCLLFGIDASSQIVRYVTPSGAGAQNGTSWTNAYNETQLQTAINQSGVNQVWVAAGTYRPYVEVGGSGTRYRTFQMKDGVSIYGGFIGNETLLSQRNWTSNLTILSGDLNGNDLISGSGATLSISNNGENSYHVFYHPSSLGLTNAAVLDGFIIKGGNANNTFYPPSYGGGMFNEACSPTLNNVSIMYSFATDGGGGLFNIQSSPILNNVFISNNLTTTGLGAGMYNYASSPQVTNGLITNNYSNNNGGGVYNSNNSFIKLTNVTIANNFSTQNGGGVYNNSSISTLNNCIIWGNSSSLANAGSQIYLSNGIATLNYTCYSNSSGDLKNVGGSFSTSNYNITTNPQFVNALSNDFRVLGSSPCCDAGLDSYNTLLTDIRGFTFGRKLYKYNANITGTIDMGAYEYKFGSDPYGTCINPTSGGTIAADQSICTGNTSSMINSTSLPSGNTEPLEYKWQASTTSASSGFTDIALSNTASFSPGVLSSSTWYKRLSRVLCKSDWTGAAESNVVKITVFPFPTAGITNNTGTSVLTCSTTTISLTATGGTSYQWDDNSTNANRTINASGTYSVAVTANGCTSNANITITSNTTPPTISVTHTDASCNGVSDGSINLSVSGTGPFSYNWVNSKPCLGNTDCSFIGAGAYCSTGNCHGITKDLSNLPADLYTVIVTGSNGCTSATSQLITEPPLPTASITSNNSPVCSGTNAVFTLSGTNGATVNYTINSGTNNTITLTGGTATITLNNVSTNQNLNLVSVTFGGCSQNLTASSVINVNQTPTASIISNNTPLCVGGNASFTLTGTTGSTLTYNINGGPNQTHTFASSTFNVTVNNISVDQKLNLVFITNGTCSQSLNTTSTVFLNPDPIITGFPNDGYNVHCGDTVQYCTPLVNGHLYSWSAFGNVSYPLPQYHNCIKDIFINPCGVYGEWTISVTETDPITGCSTTAKKNILIQTP